VLRDPRRYGIENTTDKCVGRALFDEDATPCAPGGPSANRKSALFAGGSMSARRGQVPSVQAYDRRGACAREVADGKRLIAVLLERHPTPAAE